MQKTNPTLQPQPDQVIKNLFKNAWDHRDSYARNAVICGQAMIEKRVNTNELHARKNVLLDASDAVPDPTFDDWALKICDPSHKRTLYNWMGAAERVIKFLLNKQPGDACPVTCVAESGHRGSKRYIMSKEDGDFVQRPERGCCASVREFGGER